MITASHLGRRFGARAALVDASFEVAPGTVFGLVGPNGAGKTTTLRILAGLLPPSAGTAVVAGIDVRRDPQAVRERVGWMPDYFGVYDRMTATEYLDFYASCYRVPRARVPRLTTDLLELVGLPDRGETPVDALSRGMKQRLCLARALIPDPPVLLLDEPASGLDPRARHELRELVGELSAMGKTIVISSHILPELAEMCAAFGFVDAGRVVASGSLDEILGDRDRRTVRIELRGDPAAAAAVLEELDEVVAVRAGPGLLEVDLQGDAGATSTVLAALLAAGVTVTGVAEVGAALEDVFLRLTRPAEERSA